MTTLMTPDRVRVIFDTSERIKQALDLRVFRLKIERKRRVNLSEFLTEHLESVLADELEEVDRLGKREEKSPAKKRRTES